MSAADSCGSRCRTTSLVLALVSGVLFGAGLLVAGMTDPAKVVGFLDPVHGWDPSLAFVLGSAAIVNGLAYRWIRRNRHDPWFDVRFQVPTGSRVDTRLLAGAAIFGIGWGLGGLCPGPGIVVGASGSTAGIAFVLAMLAGMWAQHQVAGARARDNTLQ